LPFISTKKIIPENSNMNFDLFVLTLITLNFYFFTIKTKKGFI